MEKSTKVYIQLAAALILLVGGSVFATRYFQPATDQRIQVQGGPTVVAPTSTPKVANADGWKETLYQPDGHGDWVKQDVKVKATGSADMAQQVVNGLLKPRKDASAIFPAETTATVKIWDGTLQIHFSSQMANFPGLKNPEAESAAIGMFTKSLVGSSQDFEDVQFFVGDKSVPHLFGQTFNTSQPFAQQPMVIPQHSTK